jgi:hypothetical protein
MKNHVNRKKICNLIYKDVIPKNIINDIFFDKEKYVSCKFCQKTFSRSDSCKRHQYICSEKESPKEQPQIVPQIVPPKDLPMIYIGHNPKVPKIFKIGKTKDFLNRLGQHKGSNPDFSYKYTFQSQKAQKIETMVKHILKDHRYNGKTEWFSIDYWKMKQIVDNVVDICDNCL